MTRGRCATPAYLIPPGVLDALADTFATEQALLGQLSAVMCRQRAAVGVDDVQAVGDTVFATHRLLLLLGETRKHRRTIHRLLGYDEELGVDQLDDLLGDTMTPRLRAERDALQQAARELSIEIDLNRQLLRETLAGNESPMPTKGG